MIEPGTDLPRPGLVGRLIRLALAFAVGLLGYGAIVDARGFWDGYAEPLASLTYVVPLALFSSWVLNELFQRSWGWRPTMVLLIAMGVTILVGTAQGDPFGPVYGIFVWIWALAFSVLLAPAHLVAVILRTPGCEMRSYAHLVTKLGGGDPSSVACPGWIDRFDGVRVLGRW